MIETGRLNWLMTGFRLFYGIETPFYGQSADIYSVRPLFILGVAVFTIRSLLLVLASGLWSLLAARLVQAIGGAAVPGLGIALVGRPVDRSTESGAGTGITGEDNGTVGRRSQSFGTILHNHHCSTKPLRRNLGGLGAHQEKRLATDQGKIQ